MPYLGSMIVGYLEAMLEWVVEATLSCFVIRLRPKKAPHCVMYHEYENTRGKGVRTEKRRRDRLLSSDCQIAHRPCQDPMRSLTKA